MTDLTKWPRLLVTGENITRDQASVVIMRTTNWDWMHTNDKPFLRRVSALLGLADPEDLHFTMKPERRKKALDVLARFEEEIDAIRELSYLTNARIVSSWIGGPKGWCDWDGTIGTANYNIGKWPSVEDVWQEWRLLAHEFPFLTMQAQLVPDEGEADKAVVHLWMEGGTARREEGSFDLITPLVELEYRALFNRHGERGVTLDRLREAHEVAKATARRW